MIVVKLGSSSGDTSTASQCDPVVSAVIQNLVRAQWAHEPGSLQPGTSPSMVVVPCDTDTVGAPILITQAVAPTTTVTPCHHDLEGRSNTGKRKQNLVLESFSAEKQKKDL